MNGSSSASKQPSLYHVATAPHLWGCFLFINSVYFVETAYNSGMDVFSHGLWGGVAFGRRSRHDFYLAILFGMLPDLLSFGIFTPIRIASIVSGQRTGDLWSTNTIPTYVHTLYSITHSLVVFIALLGILYLFARRFAVPFLAYGLHILVDIPTHSDLFFPTPFLWPLSNFTVNGIPWGEPIIYLPNIILLTAAYVWWWSSEEKSHNHPMT